MPLGAVIPILRIFDVAKAKEFYVDFLGFTVAWEHRFEPGLPMFMETSRDACKLDLSEHHGDACPGAAIRVAITELDAYNAELLAKRYGYARPGIDVTDWGTREMTVHDPFGNKLIFYAPAG